MLLAGVCGGVSLAQGTKPAPPDAATAPATPAEAAPAVPQGEILIQSHGEPPAAPGEVQAPGVAPEPQQPVLGEDAKADLTDAERQAVLITGYDLDARLTPASAGLSVRALVSLRNKGAGPLKQVALQLSSSLRWESATLVDGGARTRLGLSQHRLDTDADHTGAETEAVLALPQPLAPGGSMTLDLFYSGTVAESAGRLQRLGANAAQQRSTDWDAISAVWTGLRGFGNVLWYPVATPQLFFAEGNSLFEAIGAARLQEQDAPVRLRLTVEYSGEPPAAAYFCGRREPLKAVTDQPDAPLAAGSGIATAEFGREPLGFRTPSLFLLAQPEEFVGGAPAGAESAGAMAGYSSSNEAPAQPQPAAATAVAAATASGTPTGPPFLGVESTDSGAATGFAAAADRVAPLLREWLGPQPLSALTVVDHAGQPFQDGPLLVAPMAVLAASPQAPALVESLTHAWVQTGQPWMDDGLAQFFALLLTERAQGRAAANAELEELMRPVTLAEPDLSTGPASADGPAAGGPAAGGQAADGQALVRAADDLFYRRKGAAVWWMLRGIVGDGNLHAALSAWRTRPVSLESDEAQAVAFEHVLEKLSNQDLRWFFVDWVLRDRGLPDLTITDVGVAQEPAGAGHGAGWLVAVTVRNEGGAVADVPVTVSAGKSGEPDVTHRMRIPGLATVTERVLVEAAPALVTVNDGSTPEVRSSTHTRTVELKVR